MGSLLAYRDSRRAGHSARAGVCANGDVYDLAVAGGDEGLATIAGAFGDWPRVEAMLARPATGLPRAARVGALADVRLAAPVVEGAAIYCAAANFKDHMLAMARKLGIQPEPDPRELNVKPYHFLKPSRQTIADPDASVDMPDYAANVDWEIELVAVIGRPARNVPVARALEFVAGYTVGNDLSVRDRAFMKRPNVPDGSLFKTDFLGMKGFDKSCPIGPWLVPASAVPDPQGLQMKLWVDEELKQSSSTAQMIFTVAEQIAHLSTYGTLLPGDLVLTGTPAGTGAESDTFLKRGQTIRAVIEGIGELRTFIA